MLCFTLIVYHFLMFQVPLNNLTLQQICGTNYLIYFLPSFAFCFSPLPQPSLSLPLVKESMQ